MYVAANKQEKVKTTIKRIFSIQADSADSNEILERLLSGDRVSGTNMVVLVCAILIASMLLGDFYLFIINSYFIFFSGVLVLSILQVPKVRELTEQEWKKENVR